MVVRFDYGADLDNRKTGRCGGHRGARLQDILHTVHAVQWGKSLETSNELTVQQVSDIGRVGKLNALTGRIVIRHNIPSI